MPRRRSTASAPSRLTCTKGAVAKGANGSNAQGTTRRMSQGAAQFLAYEIYKDASHSTVWGDTADTALDVPPAPNRNPRSYTAYGRVAARAGRYRRQLHRHHRGHGEFLREREHESFNSSAPLSWRCCLRRTPRSRLNFTVTADGGQPFGVGDQRPRHGTQWRQDRRCDSRLTLLTWSEDEQGRMVPEPVV